MTKKLDYLHRSNEENHQLTKEAIETALLLLLEQKPLKKIAIAELVDRAGVSRNSFYRNYQTKEGVLWGILQDRLTKLASHNVERYARNREAGLLVIMETFQQEKAFYQLLIKEGLEGQLEEAIYTYQPLAGAEPDRMSYYRNRLVSAGMAKLLIEWLKNDCLDDPKILLKVLLA